MTKPKMIIVEDDLKLQQMLKDYFVAQDFEVTALDDGSDAVQTILDDQPDIVLLDLMLPVTDGLTICRQTRTLFKGKILMLTASDDDFDHVAGLETGADDYVTKPIKPRVLLARVRSLLRRQETNTPLVDDSSSLQFGQLTLKNTYKKCELSDVVLSLTDSEFDLLWLLASNPDTPLSRDYLTQTLRGIEYDGIDRTIDNKVVRLRKILGDDKAPAEKIQTIRGKGYLFVSTAWH
ncbi:MULTISPECIES: response regulator transcription factor [Vibrio]|jgi:two-component system response regulator RstA|uniref:DNA-binding response regulator n=2 Tax=Vibrio TaxID=662 RepID=A0A2N7NL57_9VIBR|nr:MULTISPECIES: response regulator transcription factor [Vibrio]EAQ55759.1 putative DNA-binding response regulator [Vibrio sp. MED222]OEF87602.1 DNA-binding response regulator [Vibrio tasmaniensis 1F-155]PMO81216.1 DNA-binding response regulator [Vibrio tasmaniensis]PMP15785.1 DNA-binding response regulator [Vibrio tasmaniensis]TKG31505.1 response regulator transcription factor [Vibrio tasmaniensis]